MTLMKVIGHSENETGQNSQFSQCFEMLIFFEQRVPQVKLLRISLFLLQMFDQFFLLLIATGSSASEREAYEVIDEEFLGAGLYEKVDGDTLTYKKVDGPDEEGDFNFLLASPTDPREWRLTFGKNKDDAMNEENTYYKVGCDKI